METNETRFPRSLFRALAGSDGELVVVANAYAATAAAALAAFAYGIPIGWSVALAAGLFVLLMLCLLSPRTVWIPAILGGAMLALVPAAALGALTVRFYPPGIWVGAGAGLLLGFWFGFRTLVAFGRRARGRGAGTR
ncbi:MAG TPA: hypothetical protein VKZ18_21120 [Polyangia bacterium]|nr:hypothetical protein [Polyangia bacterium]